ncbi:LPS translocon maturation chaperone LptM [Microbulbifer magnicolonia]|uniref:LPS translocon maturation chaperone LptM n=1 Tax=Microbulbifer magnicolonia TaxID=3109744 RepID=UPI002B417808|nr:lipoprotein [Microbulbifer sp. GG15]
MPKKFFPARATVFTLTFVFAAGALLSGCGQKGPLYLPQDPAAPAQPAATPIAAPGAIAPAATDDEEEQAPVPTGEAADAADAADAEREPEAEK